MRTRNASDDNDKKRDVNGFDCDCGFYMGESKDMAVRNQATDLTDGTIKVVLQLAGVGDPGEDASMNQIRIAACCLRPGVYER